MTCILRIHIFICSSDELMQCSVPVYNLIPVVKQCLKRTSHNEHIELRALYLKLLLRDGQLEKAGILHLECSTFQVICLFNVSNVDYDMQTLTLPSSRSAGWSCVSLDCARALEPALGLKYRSVQICWIKKCLQQVEEWYLYVSVRFLWNHRK